MFKLVYKASTAGDIDWLLAVDCDRNSAVCWYCVSSVGVCSLFRSLVANPAIGLFKDTSTVVWQIGGEPSCTQSAYFIMQTSDQSVSHSISQPVNPSSSSSLPVLSIGRPPAVSVTNRRRMHGYQTPVSRVSASDWVLLGYRVNVFFSDHNLILPPYLPTHGPWATFSRDQIVVTLITLKQNSTYKFCNHLWS